MKKFTFFLLLLLFIVLGNTKAQTYTGDGTTNHYTPIHKNGSGSLNNSFTMSDNGLNYVSASVVIGTRLEPSGVGTPASVSIAGVPSGSSIVKALFYYGGGTNSGITTLVFNGTNYNADIIGLGPDFCWGYVNTIGFRVDVTASVAGNGTYVFDLDEPDENVNGATLLVIYKDPAASYTGTISINDGVIEGSNSFSNTVAFPAPTIATSNATAFGIVADFQVNFSYDFNGNTGTSSPHWWDMTEVPTSFGIGTTSCDLSYTSSGGDCYGWMVAGAYYQQLSASSVTVSASDNPICSGSPTTLTASGSDSYEWSDGLGTDNPLTVSPTTTTTYTVTGTTAGETSSASITVSVNNLPAAAGIISGLTSVCQGQSSEVYTVPDIADATSYVWTLPGGATGTSSTNSITVDYSLTAVSGDIVVKGYNSCGDGTESTLGITVNTKPVFTLSPTDQSVNTDPGVCTANVSYTETLSGSPVPTLTYSFSGATTASGSGDGSGSTFNKGITNVTITATNICGTKSCNFAITVNDNVAPVFTCRSDTMVYTTPGNCWYQVPALPQANFFTPIGMGDNCSIYTWSNNSNGLTNIAGKVFNVGNNTVTWTITDGSGNTATCTQTVTVKENVPPVITCPLSQTQTTDPGVCGANITIPQFNGGCDIQHGFTGHYQPSLWTVVHINGDAGSVNTGGAPGSITIQGSNNLSSNPSEIRYQNLIPCDGTLSFDWSYSTTDVNPLWDPMGYYLNGTYHQLTINGGPLSQSGSVSIPVSNGDVFSFCINSVDNYGSASTTINSNFSAPVPGGTAGDNCGIASIINNFNNTNDASGIYPVGTTPVEWTVTDLSGNTASCTQTITVTDNEPPVITCPNDISVSNDAGLCSATITITNATATDNCSVNVTGIRSDALPLTAPYPVGITTITWTATDGALLTDNCIQTITVSDHEVPVITCPAVISTNADPGTCTFSPVSAPLPLPIPSPKTLSIWDRMNTYSGVSINGGGNYAIVSPGAAVNLSYNINTSYTGGFCPGCMVQAYIGIGGSTTIINCHDGLYDGYYDSFSGTFTAPNTSGIYYLTQAGSLDYSCWPTNNFNTDPNNAIAVIVVGSLTSIGSPLTSDNCGIDTVTNNAPAIFPIGETIVTWTATDASGNTATCTQTITVTDNENPTISCATPLASYSTDGGSCSYKVPDNSLDPTATHDNCSVASVINDFNNLSTLNGASFPKGTTTVTWTVTDGSSNTATCTQTIIVKDNEIPIISCPNDINFATTASDLTCGTNISITPATATDNCTDVTVDGGVRSDALPLTDLYPVGATTIVWTATDAVGNTNACTQTITITDGTPPIITCPADITQATTATDITCATAVTIIDALATDNCSGVTITGFRSDEQQLSNLYPVGTTLIYWTATDAANNTSNCTQTITITDGTLPTITCPADIVTTTNTGCTATDVIIGSPTVSDNCGIASITNNLGMLQSTITINMWDSWGDGWNGGYLSVYIGGSFYGNYYESTGYSSSATITLPAGATIAFYYTSGSWEGENSYQILVDGAQVYYAGGYPPTGLVYSYTSPSIATFPLGTTSINWTVTDAAGNSASCTQLVTVNDAEPPSITCPADISVNTDLDVCGAVINYNVDYADNCSGAVLSQTAGIASGSVFPVGTTTNTFVVTDGAGNMAICSFDVTVSYIEVPTLSGPSLVCAESDGNVYTTESGMTDYIWIVSPGGTITAGGSTTSNTVTVSWTTAGEQSVSVIYNDNGCSADAPTVEFVTVKALPEITAQPIDLTLCEDGTGNFTVETSASSPTYQWQYLLSGVWVNTNGLTGISGDATSMLSLSYVPLSFSGSYISCLVTSNDCSERTDSVLLTVTAIPTATISYAGIPFCRTITAPQAVTLNGTNAYTGGIFIADAGLAINPTTGDITPNSSVAGTYTVTYTIPASGGCAAVPVTTLVKINEIPPAPVISLSDNCGNSVITAVVYTGTLLWNTGETTTAITTLVSGTFSLTQTIDGCTSPAESVFANPMLVPEAPVITVSNNCGYSVLTASVYSGTLLWNTSETTSAITVSSAGTYNLIQTVGVCPSSTAYATAAPLAIPEPPVVTVVNNCGNSVLTAGSYTGTLLWSTGETTPSITVTSAGTYSVAQIVGSCSSTATLKDAAPLAVPSAPVVVVTNNCGSSILTASAYTGNLLWSNGATTGLIIVATPGTYTVTQTLGECTSNPGSGLAAPLAIPATPVVSVANNCANSVLTASAYTGALTWNTGATTSAITVTVAGTYSVSQTVGSCTSAAAFVVSAPKTIPPAPLVTVTNSCGNSLLTATSYVGSLLWSNGATTSSINIATPGPYSVTQTLAGCTSVAANAFAAPVALPATPVVTVVNYCGYTVLSTTAIAGPLLWSTGATTTAITVTTAGTYSVRQTVGSCISLPGSGVAAPLAVPSAPAVAVANNCGTSVITASAYTGTLTWSTGATTNPITVSAAGIYHVTQTVGGCTSASGNVTATPLSVPPQLVVTVANHCGNSLLTVSPFTGTLAWNTGATTSSITVAAGTYTVTQSAGGCTSTPASGVAAPLAVPAPPVVSVANHCGNAVLTASTYTGSLYWSTSQTTPSVTVATAGTYTVTQTVGGCTSNAANAVAAPLAVPATPLVSVANNCGGSVLTASAFTGSLLWSNTATTNPITVTTAGTFTVTQTVGSCVSLPASVVANPLAYPVVDLGTDITLCVNQSADIDAGNFGSFFQWTPGGQSTQIITVDTSWLGAGANSIQVTVTAPNGCETTDEILVTFNPCTGIEDNNQSISISVVPNPSNGLFYVTVNGLNEAATLSIYAANGQIVYKEEMNNAGFTNKPIDLQSFATGMYFLRLVSKNYAHVEKIIVE
ncbi:MAG: HYR domain-containing protein [Bacteroidota bacterium]